MSTRRIYDPIYGFIEITPLMQQIIDTLQFQRLRELKQLGAAYFVYPSATHTRFEHSLGVSHLAGLVGKSLQKSQPELCITDRKIELLRIAGLIHDIGHGPFSHLYDSPEIRGDEPEHEERGCSTFKMMCEYYDFPLTKTEIELILDMVDPKGWKQHLWLNQIIANKISQIDVDKIDYIRRDCYHLGMPYVSGTEFTRIISDMRVCKIVQNSFPIKFYISWPKNLQFEIYTLFSTRYRLHKEVYTHHTVRAYEYIIKKILVKIKSKGHKFNDLTDSVGTCLLHDEFREEQLMMATRNIPKIMPCTYDLTANITTNNKDDWTESIEPLIEHIYRGYYVDKVHIGFTSGRYGNPLENTFYYDTKPKHTSKLTIAKCIDPYSHSFLIPKNYSEIIIRMYSIPDEYLSKPKRYGDEAAMSLWRVIENFVKTINEKQRPKDKNNNSL